MKNARDRQAGMTLLELLVGLVIFALLMAVLAQTEYFVMGSWRRSDRGLRTQRELGVCQEVMLRQLRSAAPFRPPRVWLGVPSFWGTAGELTFVSCQPVEPGGPPGLWLATYSLSPGLDDEGGVLTVQMRPALDPGYWRREAAPVEGVSLLSGVEGLRFSYVGWDWRNKQTRLVNSWMVTAAGRMPLAVQLEMTVNGKKVLWYLPLACGRG